MATIWVDLLGQDFRQTFHDAGGQRTRAIEAGIGDNDKTPLIFLHGTGGHAEAYMRNIAAHAAHFQVYAIDMLGHGYSARPDCDYTIDDLVDHLLGFMDAIEAPRAILSGESLGAMVASWAAIREPQRVIKLVQNTGTLMPPNEQGRQQLLDALERSKKAAGNLTREAVRTRLAWLMYEPEKSVTEELVDVRYTIYSQPGMPATMGRIAQNVLGGVTQPAWCERWANPELMHKITCPTLLLWTRHNPGQPAELAQQALDYLPDGRMVTLENSAHWPQWEEADAFNRAHLEFLLS